MNSNMPLSVRLTADDIDEVQYLTRANESQELDHTLAELSQRYNTSKRDILAASIDAEYENTVLHLCAANGLAALLKEILDSLQLSEGDGAYINKPNLAGNTALHWAALNGHVETAKLLVQAGANLWVRNRSNNLAIFEAEQAGKDEVVAYLLQVGGAGGEGDAEEIEDPEANDAEAEQANGVDTNDNVEGSSSLNPSGEPQDTKMS